VTHDVLTQDVFVHVRVGVRVEQVPAADEPRLRRYL
jgi:hypothetical protein